MSSACGTVAASAAWYALAAPPVGGLQVALIMLAQGQGWLLHPGDGSGVSAIGGVLALSYLYGLIPALIGGTAAGIAAIFCRSRSRFLLASTLLAVALGVLASPWLPSSSWWKSAVMLAAFFVLPACAGALAFWAAAQKR